LKKYSNVATDLELKPHKILRLEKGLKKLLNIQEIDLEIFQKLI
jgi:hypothetical protein